MVDKEEYRRRIILTAAGYSVITASGDHHGGDLQGAEKG